MKSQRPRLFFTFCFLFSFITVLISSLFFYYPDSFKTTPPSPSISFISDDGGGNGRSDRYTRYGYSDGGINKNAQYVMGPRPVRGRFASGSGRVEEVGRHYYGSNGHQPPQQHHDEDDPLLLDYIEGHHQDHHGELHPNDPLMQNNNDLDSSGSGDNLERIRHQSHHPFERHHLSLSELEQKSNFSQVIENRLIHLDLKGAPPKVGYIKDVSLACFTHLLSIIFVCSHKNACHISSSITAIIFLFSDFETRQKIRH